jgi:hypothetical protein
VNLVKFSKVLGRNPNQNAVQRDEHILHLIDENPNLSVHQINQMFETSFTVWKLLKNENMHPYHDTRVQALRPKDFNRRTNFCGWLRLLVENPAVLDHIILQMSV